MIENFKNGWLKEDPRVTAGVLLGIAVFITLNILLSRSKKNLKMLKQQAVDNNAVINAKICYRHRKRNTDDLKYYGRYKYTVNGKEKEYSVYSNYPLPDTIELYPRNKSRTKFFSAYDERSNAAIAANCLAGIAVCFLVLFITGYIG